MDIFLLTKTTQVIQNEVILSDVIKVKQTLPELDFVRKKYLFNLFVMHLWYMKD